MLERSDLDEIYFCRHLARRWQKFMHWITTYPSVCHRPSLLESCACKSLPLLVIVMFFVVAQVCCITAMCHAEQAEAGTYRFGDGDTLNDLLLCPVRLTLTVTMVTVSIILGSIE